MIEAQSQSEQRRCGYVALIGAPNAGKSTLLNKLVGGKVSIVSRKVQTTRFIIRGIAMTEETQIIFVDTPGIFEPQRRLDRAMVKSAWSGAGDADVIALLVDAQRGFDEQNRAICERLSKQRAQKILILNKIDMVPRENLLALAQQGHAILNPDFTFMISASNGDGTKEFMLHLEKTLPVGPWLYPDDQLSDLPMRLLAAEITREKLFDRLHDELPYALTVETDTWEIKDDKSIRIDQTIFVERESQKKILLGKNGEMIKSISMASRKEIAELIDAKVHLFLFAKVRDNWGDDPERYASINLEFPK